MTIGIALIPSLSIQYFPPLRNANISVNTHWNGASAKTMEAEVCSKIEGILASVSGVEDIKSTSSYENCTVSVRFKRGMDQDAIRFDISSRLRSIYPHLPQGVSYPSISGDIKGEAKNPLLIYTVSAELPPNDIKQAVEKYISKPLSKIEGIENINIYGDVPKEWIVYFDAVKCNKYKITPQNIQASFKIHQGSFPLGMVILENNSPSKSISFRSQEMLPEQWKHIEISNSGGHIFTLGDIASIVYNEKTPTSYFRINGLNNITIAIYPNSDENQIKLSKKIRKIVSSAETELPQGFSVLLIEDSAKYIISELSKVVYRTGLSVLILLAFVFLVSRNFKYLILIIVSLLANILLSIICYSIFDLEIHLYSLAGMTVSLGMLIDTSIMMLDHYARFKNKKVFLAMLAATLTTIGALSIVYFLPENQRQNLVDFSIVIILNLSVSLLIAFFFIPSLLNTFPIKLRKSENNTSKYKRKIVKATNVYESFLRFAKAKKWIFILLIILAFGIPVHLLPNHLDANTGNAVAKGCKDVYNSTFGSRFFQYEIKKWLEYTLGGSFRVFSQNIFSNFKISETQQSALYIHGAMPDGCSIKQLNEALIQMETFLSQFNEIDVFRTEILAYDIGSIKVTFKNASDNNIFPEKLKSTVLQETLNIGGVKWTILGIGQAFKNNLYSGNSRMHSITLKGYSYDQLYTLAQELQKNILKNPRVIDPLIAGSVYELENKTEFFMQLNPTQLALVGMPLHKYYSLLQPLFYDVPLGYFHNGQTNEKIVLRTSPDTRFDAWHLNKEIIYDEQQAFKLSEFGNLAKTNSGNTIHKENQEYLLTLGFNYMGGEAEGIQFTKDEIKRLHKHLPVGYRVHRTKGDFFADNTSLPFILLLLVALIIYFICAVLFESLRQPLVIIVLIPISFIGVFLTFWGLSIPFDEGGFASFVLLSGIVVNAGIYLINEYNIILRKGVKAGLHTYLRCFHRKIVPISLTILSTALGLLPFVIISKEPFWYSFAIGGIGGLLFSFIAIFVFLPIFFPLLPSLKANRNRK